MRRIWLIAVGFGLTLAIVGLLWKLKPSQPQPMPPDSVSNLTISSPEFGQNQTIPTQYTCDGVDISPPLVVENLPTDAAVWALLVDDPDAPVGDWVHWLVWNIPAQQTSLPADWQPAPPAVVGQNSWGNMKYQGPCPPSGEHRYVFKVYALSQPLELAPGSSKAEFLQAVADKTIAYGELVGRYQRGGN